MRLIVPVFLVVCILGMFLHFPARSNALEVSNPKIVSYRQLEKQVQYPEKPIRLRIPAAKVHATVEELSITDGRMQQPTGIENVGWYHDSVYPGEKGHAVLAGHLDDEEGSPAVFARLHLLRPHDIISVEDKDGVSRQFFVTGMKEYRYTDVPLATYFTNSLSANLILITCSGAYNTKSSTYEKRLVVFATLRQ